jgi:hypothetical protein
MLCLFLLLYLKNVYEIKKEQKTRPTRGENRIHL